MSEEMLNDEIQEEIIVNQPVVEETAQEQQQEPHRFTQEELDSIVEKRLARERRKLEREYDSKYSKYEELADIVTTGVEAQSFDEALEKTKDFYGYQGLTPKRSQREEEVLARAEADEILDLGFEEASREADRMAQKGYDNMTPREKLIFTQVATKLNEDKRVSALSKLGIKAEVYNSEDFKSYEKKFNKDVPIEEIYDMYSKTTVKAQRKAEPIGSMKGSKTPGEVKDFYTHEEASRFTRADLDKNPSLFKAITNSMSKW